MGLDWGTLARNNCCADLAQVEKKKLASTFSSTSSDFQEQKIERLSGRLIILYIALLHNRNGLLSH